MLCVTTRIELRKPYSTEESHRLGKIGIDFKEYVTTSDAGDFDVDFPQILCAEPGRGVTLDYSRSDLWTVGTLAYELFGCWNPFYRNSAGQRLDSRSYSEADLPPLPGACS